MLTLMTKLLMTKTKCLDVSMVILDVGLLYMSPQLRRGGRKGMGQRLDTCFKASARSSGRRWRMCVWIVRTQMRSKMKFGPATLRQTVPVLYSMCIAHMTVGYKYVINKSCFSFILCHQCITICVSCSIFINEKWQNKTHLNWGSHYP